MTARFNPFPDTIKASRGDLEALRTLANACADLAVGNELAASEGLVIARLACARSDNDPRDVRAILGLLSVAEGFAETPELIDGLHAEAIAWASMLADAGDEEAIDTLAALVGKATDEANEAATLLRSLMAESAALG